MRFSRLLALIAGTATLLGAQARPALRTTLDIYFIDVEGGQATLLVTPRGESWLIDAGFPGTGTFASRMGDPVSARDPQRIVAAARDAGISRIDHLMVTHYHADHVGGVPELAALMPIGEFIDHAGPIEESETNVPGTREVYAAYLRARAASRHRDPKPGDHLAIKGLDVTVVSSLGEVLKKPVGGASAAACAGDGLPAQEKFENPRSLGVLVRFGKFRFLDVGDLSGAPLHALSCPQAMLAPVDVYLVAHHGGLDAAAPEIFATIQPRAAVVNNGPTKGGAPQTISAIKRAAGVDGWQLHRAMADTTANLPADRIVNADESTSAWLKVSASEDGSFTVTNGRTGTVVAYPPRSAFDERVRTATIAPGILATIVEPAKVDPRKPVSLVFYALPNGNSTAQTMGRRLTPGLDWHFDIQHIAAQTRALRGLGLSQATVVYLEADAKSWPSWRSKLTYPVANARLVTVLDSIRRSFAGRPLEVTLAGHSGGGSLMFGVIEGADSLPAWLDRIAFLDANYNFTPAHGEKLRTWLAGNRRRRLEVVAYDDREITLDGKKVVSDSGGTWRATQRMIDDFSHVLTFAKDTLGPFDRWSAPQIEFLRHPNPANRILHTEMIGEMNAYMHVLLRGRAAYDAGPSLLKVERAYTPFVLP